MVCVQSGVVFFIKGQEYAFILSGIPVKLFIMNSRVCEGQCVWREDFMPFGSPGGVAFAELSADRKSVV